jgi:uncharacterized protein
MVSQVISVGDAVKVKVIALDKERRRISLSKKACEEPSTSPPASAPYAKEQGTNRRYNNNATSPYPNKKPPSSEDSRYIPRTHVEKKPHNFLASEKGLFSKNNKTEEQESGSASIQDLLNKFNSNRV